MAKRWAQEEDKIKGRRKPQDLGPWATLAADLLAQSDGSRELETEAEDDGSLVPDEEENIGAGEADIGIDRDDGSSYTDDGGTHARDSLEVESTLDPRLREIFGVGVKRQMSLWDLE